MVLLKEKKDFGLQTLVTAATARDIAGVVTPK